MSAAAFAFGVPACSKPAGPSLEGAPSLDASVAVIPAEASVAIMVELRDGASDVVISALPSASVSATPALSDAGAKPDGLKPDGGASAKVPKAIRVPAAAVLRIVQAGSVHGTPAQAPDGSPRGVALSGVSGSGLQDGDVVTHIEGAAVNSTTDGIMIIAQALQSGRKTISGVVLRGERPIQVTVEVPPRVPPKAMPSATAK
jgi:S1-C subfamily serine protease